MMRSAAHSAHVTDVFARAGAARTFDAIERGLTGSAEIPVCVPVRLGLPGGVELEMGSLLDQLSCCQDALAEGLKSS